MRKQRLLIVLIVTIAGLALAGCGESSPKDTSDWTYNPPEEFKQQDKQAKNGATVFIGPDDQGFKANLMVEASSYPDGTAQKIAEDTLEKAKQKVGGTVKEQEPYTIPDSDAYTWLLTANHNGVDVSQRQFFVKKNKVAIRFTLTATTKSMDKWDQELADSLKSFKWGRQ